MKIAHISPIIAFCLIGCATAPRTYQPPSNVKLEASTGRLSKAVTQSHVLAKKAQASVTKASDLSKQAKSEVQKIKDVPLAVVNEMNDLQNQLDDASSSQADLEKQLVEADNAKKQVEQDKASYYAQAQKLADQATAENTKAVKAEKSLSWYRWHWWGSWIVLGLGIVACIAFYVLKFAGKWTFP